MQHIILEASIKGVILTILIVYVIYIIATRFIFPSLMRKFINDFQQRFTDQNQNKNQPLKKEGEVSITFIDKDKVQNHNDKGEYIDYEEVK